MLSRLYKVTLRDGVDLISRGRRKSKGGNTAFPTILDMCRYDMSYRALLVLLLYVLYIWYQVGRCVFE